MKLRVCIADDHQLMLNGVRDALLKSGDIDVVGWTDVGEEVAELVERHQPDLLLLDHHMGDVDGVGTLKEIKQRWPSIRVVMLSASENPKEIGDALSAGASAYIGKRINADDLASVLRQVVSGVVYQRSAHYEEPVVVGDKAGLTDREQTILEAMACGHSTKVISRDLWITEKTVKFHLTNIYRKLSVHNRTGAMRYAYEHGLVTAAPGVPQPAAITA